MGMFSTCLLLSYKESCMAVCLPCLCQRNAGDVYHLFWYLISSETLREDSCVDIVGDGKHDGHFPELLVPTLRDAERCVDTAGYLVLHILYVQLYAA